MIGVILIRHLHLTRSIIGLIIGITWIVQGLAALIGGISGGVREGRAWWIIFGAASLIAGIAVTVTPASSLDVLATLLGIWFMVMGVFEIIGGLLLRHALRTTTGADSRLTQAQDGGGAGDGWTDGRGSAPACAAIPVGHPPRGG